MIRQVLALAALVAAAHAGAIGIGSIGLGGLGGIGGYGGYGGYSGIGISSGIVAAPQIIDVSTPAKYEFQYGVADAKTGDRKQQSEVRLGDTVKGEYSLAEPDGTIRVVKYTADKINGFNAVVSRIGAAGHPQLLATSGVALGGIGLAGGLGYHG